jgi:hypothetical protein
MGDSFHCFSGSVLAALKRRRCSSCVTENQYLNSRMPERTSIVRTRALAHEFEVVVGRAEAHDPLDARAVVPGAVEEDDLAGRRQVLDVALEIPLRASRSVGLVQRHHARAARIQMFHEALDGAALAGRVAALEEMTIFWPVSSTQRWTFSNST